MKFKLPLFLYLNMICNLVQSASQPDSLQRKHGFGLMISSNSLMLKLASDNPANFFYSEVLLEPQYRFKQHLFGLGFNRRKGFSEFSKHDVPYNEERLSFTFVPTYSFPVLNSKFWQLYTGMGLVFNYKDTFQKSESKYETITRQSTEIEKGVSAFARVQYNLHRHVSINLELPVYLTLSRLRVTENYPLTPSMSSSVNGQFIYKKMFFIPSNLFIRFSF